jgi:hypothetical protein
MVSELIRGSILNQSRFPKEGSVRELRDQDSRVLNSANPIGGPLVIGNTRDTPQAIRAYTSPSSPAKLTQIENFQHKPVCPLLN